MSMFGEGGPSFEEWVKSMQGKTFTGTTAYAGNTTHIRPEDVKKAFKAIFGAEEPEIEMSQRDYLVRAAETVVEHGPEHPDSLALVRRLSARSGHTGAVCWMLIKHMSQGDLRR